MKEVRLARLEKKKQQQQQNSRRVEAGIVVNANWKEGGPLKTQLQPKREREYSLSQGSLSLVQWRNWYTSFYLLCCGAAKGHCWYTRWSLLSQSLWGPLKEEASAVCVYTVERKPPRVAFYRESLDYFSVIPLTFLFFFKNKKTFFSFFFSRCSGSLRTYPLFPSFMNFFFTIILIFLFFTNISCVCELPWALHSIPVQVDSFLSHLMAWERCVVMEIFINSKISWRNLTRGE